MDDIDRKLLARLQEDATTPMAELEHDRIRLTQPDPINVLAKKKS